MPLNSFFVELDPEGDLVLEVGKVPSASSPVDALKSNGEAEELLHKGPDMPQDTEVSPRTPEQHQEREPSIELGDPQQTPHYRILICSKLLTWTSPVFQAMLNGAFAEAQDPRVDANGRRVLDLPEDDPVAILRLCQILHHKPGTHPEKYEFKILHDVAILSDKYGFHATISMWLDKELARWLPTSTKSTFSSFSSWANKRALEMIQLAYLASNEKKFKNATALYAFVEEKDQVRARARRTVDSTDGSDRLADRMVSLQAYLDNRFRKIPGDALNVLTSYFITKHPNMRPSAVRQAIGDGSGPSLCDGMVKQLAFTAAFIQDKKLSSSQSSVQQYVQFLRKTFTDQTPCKALAAANTYVVRMDRELTHHDTGTSNRVNVSERGDIQNEASTGEHTGAAHRCARGWGS
ncbi:hypothetical protein H2200_004478 [Cladophialophora chaetospira]|uniref:BTB domain-containing protein n=1 Tax=Cladophialophora chaetospira TaxID=386627 RepID=A0AA38XDV0_9EURO|nr:hypothetical protein H2200_004478 [Cladophialophora chaetospira]